MDTAAYTSPVKRKVLGDINNGAQSPISPNANLKLLTKVAAARFDSIENEDILKFFATPPKSEVEAKLEPEVTNLNQHRKGGRKFKSLGFLCDKFLKLYPLDVPKHSNCRHILLTSLAQHLVVEKRRVYDIINVVESLQMATKVSKNTYSWAGRSCLVDTLSHLKVYADQTGLLEYVRMQQLNRKLFIHLHPGEVETTDAHIFSENSTTANLFRNERRIGVLCQKFVMIFLVSLKDGIVNLDLAADILIGEQSKMRLRRLYDIANILVSLGIIEKIEFSKGWKKPAFRYVGPPILNRKLDINECPMLQKLMIGEVADLGLDTSSNEPVSEDSIEMSRIENQRNLIVTKMDHSYSLYPKTSPTKPVAVVEPAAKKKLVFSSRGIKVIVESGTGAVQSLLSKEEAKERAVKDENKPFKTTSSILPIVGCSSVPQHIQNGAIYKAVQVGNNFQLIRLD